MNQKLAVPQTAKILTSFMEPEDPLPYYHYHTLSQINPQSCYHVSLRPYIILPSKSRSSKWSLSVRSTTEILYAPLFSHMLSTCSALLVWAGIVQSVQRLATSWTVRGLNPSGGRDIPHPSKLVLGPTQPPIQCVPGLSWSNWPGRGLDHPPHLTPRLKKEQSYTSTTPLGFRGLFQGELYLCLYLLLSSFLM